MYGDAAAHILTALHAAKQELAEELEANLKQLKTVLEETQRIQRQMEAVLKEARAEAGLREKVNGDGKEAVRQQTGQAPARGARQRQPDQAQRRGQQQSQGQAEEQGQGRNQSQGQGRRQGQDQPHGPAQQQGQRHPQGPDQQQVRGQAPGEPTWHNQPHQQQGAGWRAGGQRSPDGASQPWGRSSPGTSPDVPPEWQPPDFSGAREQSPRPWQPPEVH